MSFELQRQAFHLALGLVALAVLLVLGRQFLMASSFFFMLIGFLLANRLVLGAKAGITEWFIERFERKDVLFPGYGSACYGLGVLFLAGFLHEPAAIAASLIILAVGDGLSTVAGKMGKIRLPWNPGKTLEGTLAFVAGSLAGFVFVGWAIIPVALVAALVESIDWPLDDNLMVPVACTVMFWFF